MIHALTRPIPRVLALAFCTFIPVLMAAVRVVQVPLGTWHDDSLRLAAVAVAFFVHALAGVLFGELGPLQFVRSLRLRFGVIRRLAGRVFVLAGAGLALSALGLLLLQIAVFGTSSGQGPRNAAASAQTRRPRSIKLSQRRQGRRRR